MSEIGDTMKAIFEVLSEYEREKLEKKIDEIIIV